MSKFNKTYKSLIYEFIDLNYVRSIRRTCFSLLKVSEEQKQKINQQLNEIVLQGANWSIKNNKFINLYWSIDTDIQNPGNNYVKIKEIIQKNGQKYLVYINSKNPTYRNFDQQPDPDMTGYRSYVNKWQNKEQQTHQVAVRRTMTTRAIQTFLDLVKKQNEGLKSKADQLANNPTVKQIIELTNGRISLDSLKALLNQATTLRKGYSTDLPNGGSKRIQIYDFDINDKELMKKFGVDINSEEYKAAVRSESMSSEQQFYSGCTLLHLYVIVTISEGQLMDPSRISYKCQHKFEQRTPSKYD